MLAALLIGCTGARSQEPNRSLVTTRTSTTKPVRWRIPVTASTTYPEHVFRHLTPISNVSTSKTPNSADLPALSPEKLATLLSAAVPLEANDPEVDGSCYYVPWFEATFDAKGQRWSVSLFLWGTEWGIGTIADGTGAKGAFRFKPPHGDGG
jgi:hypothetical protein